MIGECKLERMAVERPYRGAGVGRRLLEAAEDEARRQGASGMLLHAQRRAEDFYAAEGYVAEGETFIEEGIEHVANEEGAVSADPEIRIDQLTGLRTILAPARAERPIEFVSERPPAKAEDCPFCEGREDRTPPETWADRPGGGPRRQPRLAGPRRPQPLSGGRRGEGAG